MHKEAKLTKEHFSCIRKHDHDDDKEEEMNLCWREYVCLLFFWISCRSVESINVSVDHPHIILFWSDLVWNTYIFLILTSEYIVRFTCLKIDCPQLSSFYPCLFLKKFFSLISYLTIHLPFRLYLLSTLHNVPNFYRYVRWCRLCGYFFLVEPLDKIVWKQMQLPWNSKWSSNKTNSCILYKTTTDF